MALESFDLRGYDLVVSSESGPAKGVITSSSTRHICYCHTPMRYLWDLYPAYRNEWTRSRWKRMAMTPLSNYLRLWDYASAARVDQFVANSENTRQRIWKTYRREVGGGLSAGGRRVVLLETGRRLLPHRFRTGRVQANRCSRARVLAQWPTAAHRRRRPGIPVFTRRRSPERRVSRAGRRCRIARAVRALPGILAARRGGFRNYGGRVPCQRQTRHRAGRGGALETVPSFGGVFYDDPAGLGAAVERFDAMEFRPAELQSWARRFSEEEFARKMSEVLAAPRPTAVRR